MKVAAFLFGIFFLVFPHLSMAEKKYPEIDFDDLNWLLLEVRHEAGGESISPKVLGFGSKPFLIFEPRDRSQFHSYLSKRLQELDTESRVQDGLFGMFAATKEDLRRYVFTTPDGKYLLTILRSAKGFEAIPNIIVPWELHDHKLRFKGILNKIIKSSIGKVHIREIHPYGNHYLMVGDTTGGDAGDVWGSIWFALWTEPDGLDMLHSEPFFSEAAPELSCFAKEECYAREESLGYDLDREKRAVKITKKQRMLKEVVNEKAIYTDWVVTTKIVDLAAKAQEVLHIVNKPSGKEGHGRKNSPAKQINSFDDCATAGYPVMESYPRPCKTPDGRTFTETLSQQNTKTRPCAQQGKMCGGIAGILCCPGLTCKLDGNYPDASGVCIK